jgi:hypothetical protein
MTQLEVLLKVTKKLAKLKLPYMLTGAYAVSFYGKPRTTHDIDLKVEITSQDIDKIYDVFKDSFYVSKEMINDAIKHRQMFNLIENESQTKVDFWIVKETEFDKERFRRRILTKIHNVDVYISSAEDTILIKLVWFKQSDVQKHFDDALGIIEIQRSKLDFEYLNKWSQRLTVKDLLDKLLLVAKGN